MFVLHVAGRSYFCTCRISTYNTCFTGE